MMAYGDKFCLPRATFLFNSPPDVCGAWWWPMDFLPRLTCSSSSLSESPPFLRALCCFLAAAAALFRLRSSASLSLSESDPDSDSDSFLCFLRQPGQRDFNTLKALIRIMSQFGWVPG